MVIAEAAHQRFVGAELRGLLPANGVADTPRQHAEGIRTRRDDARDELVLHRKDLIGLEAPVVGFRPEMRAGDAVHELHRDPKL